MTAVSARPLGNGCAGYAQIHVTNELQSLYGGAAGPWEKGERGERVERPKGKSTRLDESSVSPWGGITLPSMPDQRSEPSV